MRRDRPRKKLALKLKALRKAAGRSHEVMANSLRISRTQWSRIEMGKQTIPYERLNDVAKLLACQVVDILGPVA